MLRDLPTSDLPIHGDIARCFYKAFESERKSAAQVNLVKDQLENSWKKLFSWAAVTRSVYASFDFEVRDKKPGSERCDHFAQQDHNPDIFQWNAFCLLCKGTKEKKYSVLLRFNGVSGAVGLDSFRPIRIHIGRRIPIKICRTYSV